MASTSTDLPYKMHVTPDNTGLWRIKQTNEAAQKVSELLQKDMEKHHVFFNQDGFHNHIPHHLLALYGTGAPPSSLETAYANNATYQRPVLPPHTNETSISLHPWPSAAAGYLGNEAYYPDFLRFFQSEIRASSSWKPVVRKYLFSPSETGDELLVRLFAGFLHPLIQLMYGVEWGQEAVVAEGLAQAAVHDAWVGGYLLNAERLARSKGEQGEVKDVGVMDLVAAVRADDKLAGAARNGDANKIRDGVLARARDEMLDIAARVRVRPNQKEIEEKTAEMFDASLFVAAAAAMVKESKQPKFDFFLMHHVNASPFFVALNAQDWVPLEAKARLLEWKIRMDLIEYAARGAPELSAQKLAAYKPRKPDAGKSLADIISRLHTFEDDGHSIKLGRAAVICHDSCRKYDEDGRHWLKVKGDDLWNKVCHLIVDSVEASGPRWVRSCGFDEAWEEVPNL
ncbi:hypothetical protein VTI28DRAFT_9298 [Corynascus sepedonium]